MKLASKKNSTFYITVNSKKNKILLTTSGFVTITKGNHNKSTTINPDVLEQNYVIPDNVSIG